MATSLTIAGLGGSMARNSRSRAAGDSVDRERECAQAAERVAASG
jgi:hypothetical protein